MRVFLVFFYLAAVVGCKASVNKTQLASGFQDPDAANENEMERLPPVITDLQKIKRLATGLAERGVPEDLIQDVIRELTSERVSLKKFTSKIVDINFPNPSGSPVPFLSTNPGVLANPPMGTPVGTLPGHSTDGSSISIIPGESPKPPNGLFPNYDFLSGGPKTSYDFLPQNTQNSLAPYITRSDFNALCA